MTTIHDAIELHAHLPGHVLLMDRGTPGGMVLSMDTFRAAKLVLLVDRKAGLAAVAKAEVPLLSEDVLDGRAAIRLG